MPGQSSERTLLEELPQLKPLAERMRKLGAEADRIRDFPPGFFDGIDVRMLNFGGFDSGHKVTSSVTGRCRVFEYLGRADPALAAALPGPSLTLPILYSLASPAQRREVTALLESDQPHWGCFALTEPQSGSDAMHLALTAKTVSGGYVLNGTKCYIGNAGRAHYGVVFATVESGRGPFGIRAFLAEMPRAGLTINYDVHTLGLRAVRLAHLIFKDCFVPSDALLGHGTKADTASTFVHVQKSFDSMRPCLASLMTGAGFSILDRLRSLRAPGAHLRSAIANLVNAFEGPLASARMLCQHAAALVDSQSQASTPSSVCKLFATEQVCRLSQQAIMLPGLAKHEESQDIFRLYRDVQGFRMMEGTSDMQRLMIARERISHHNRPEKPPAPLFGRQSAA